MTDGRQADGQTGKEFVIEEVTDLDAVWNELTGLFLALNEYHSPWISRRLSSDWEERWRDYLEPGPDRLILMARHDGEAIAYLTTIVRHGFGLFDEVAALIDDAYVKDAYRRTGIGGQLLAHSEVWSRTHGATELRLNVNPSNEIGLGFWRKSGFDFLSHVMSKPLEASP
jgi:GNAT superfamily N-acetyltransferase